MVGLGASHPFTAMCGWEGSRKASTPMQEMDHGERSQGRRRVGRRVPPQNGARTPLAALHSGQGQLRHGWQSKIETMTGPRGANTSHPHLWLLTLGTACRPIRIEAAEIRQKSSISRRFHKLASLGPSKHPLVEGTGERRTAARVERGRQVCCSDSDKIVCNFTLCPETAY